MPSPKPMGAQMWLPPSVPVIQAEPRLSGNRPPQILKLTYRDVSLPAYGLCHPACGNENGCHRTTAFVRKEGHLPSKLVDCVHARPAFRPFAFAQERGLVLAFDQDIDLHAGFSLGRALPVTAHTDHLSAKLVGRLGGVVLDKALEGLARIRIPASSCDGLPRQPPWSPPNALPVGVVRVLFTIDSFDYAQL